jgi:hypothetical protein
MVLVEIRLLREGERARRLLSRLETETGVDGIDVVGGRAFPMDAPNWASASAELDEVLTRVAGDNWREYLAFVAPQGYDRPSKQERV